MKSLGQKLCMSDHNNRDFVTLHTPTLFPSLIFLTYGDIFSINHSILAERVQCKGRQLRRVIVIHHKPLYQLGLANSRVAEQNDLGGYGGVEDQGGIEPANIRFVSLVGWTLVRSG